MMPSIFFLILAVTAVQGGTLQKPKTKPKPNPEPKATDNNWRNFVHRSRARAGKHLNTKYFKNRASSMYNVTQVVHVTIVIFTFILFRRRPANF